jgi:alcohol dehydrogenase class IV
MNFEFSTAIRIVFGPGSISEAVSTIASTGHHALIVHGNSSARLESFINDLQARGISCTLFSTLGEPTVERVLDGVKTARETGCDCVVGYGGGSALDGAKAIAAFITNPGDPLDFLEVVGKGRPLTQPCAPCVCIPTTAGTGSEVTRNAVLVSSEERIKISLRSPKMLPLLAVVDPVLTHSLPPAVTAGTGMDALTQLIEPFVSHRANVMTDALCRDGIHRAARQLRTAYHDGSNPEAREHMALASLYGGMALANAGLGAVHGFAASLGGMMSIPHGVACARLLPCVMSANLQALHARAEASPALSRYKEIAFLLTGRRNAYAEEGVDWVHALCDELAIPPLSKFGLTKNDFETVALKAQNSSSMKGNPIQLSFDELVSILEQAFEE